MSRVQHVDDAQAVELVIDPQDSLAQAAELHALSDGRLWDPGLVVREILQHTEAMVCHAHEIGRRLLWAKAALPHGQFEGWCVANLPFSARSAQHYMRIATWFRAHPELVKPLAAAGLKKTLLLTTLPKTAVQQLVEDGRLGEVPAEELGDTPYVVLRDEVAKLKKQLGAALDGAKGAEDKRDELAERNRELERRLATVSRVLPAEPESEVMKHLARAHERFDAAMSGVGVDLDMVMAALPTLSAGGRAKVEGLLAYMDTRLRYESLRWREIAGEDVVGAEFDAVLSAPRPASALYAIPGDRLVPTFGAEGA